MSHLWARLFYKGFCVKYTVIKEYSENFWDTILSEKKYYFNDYRSARMFKAKIENKEACFVEFYAINKYGELKEIY